MIEIGANFCGKSCIFCVWAPFAKEVNLRLVYPEKIIFPMEKQPLGYWEIKVNDLKPGTFYFFELGNKKLPDPASMFQPKGIYGPSQVIDHEEFAWQDKFWKGVDLRKMIMYELHIGTFTKSGTFEAALPRIKELRKLGINAIEVMPVAQFPGKRNWGYDGTFFFSVQNSYGGPQGFKKFINACHKEGIAVILDVVYNHGGPEGNYLMGFGPYFTDNYKTPWGKALNFDGPYSDEVKNFFIQNSLYWFKNFHLDGLRIDAIHQIKDFSANNFLSDLSYQVQQFNLHSSSRRYLIAESDLNDAKAVNEKNKGGLALDAQWLDDFHHSLFTLISSERGGHLMDYGELSQLAKAYKAGFVYSGEYSIFRKKRHGNSSKNIPAKKFIVFMQNHDQVGNRMRGERLASLVPFEAQKLCAGVIMTSPYIPLLFMGEEYAEQNPFIFFTDYSDNKLISLVTAGRKKEFRDFNWRGQLPAHYSNNVFMRSKLSWEKRYKGKHKIILELYKNLIALRKKREVLCCADKKYLTVSERPGKLLIVKRWAKNEQVYCFMNFSSEKATFKQNFSQETLFKLIDSSEKKWAGPGSSLPRVLKKDVLLCMSRFGFCLYTNKKKRK